MKMTLILRGKRLSKEVRVSNCTWIEVGVVPAHVSTTVKVSCHVIRESGVVPMFRRDKVEMAVAFRRATALGPLNYWQAASLKIPDHLKTERVLWQSSIELEPFRSRARIWVEFF